MIRLTATTTGFAELASALRDAADRIDDRLAQAVRTLSEQLEEALRREAPVGKSVPGRTRPPGSLRDSITFDIDGTRSVFLADQVAEYVIGGTRPHEIHGNPLLHFWWDKKGGWVTFRTVHHPGTSPHDFRIPPLDQAADAAEDELAAVGDWLAELL